MAWGWLEQQCIPQGDVLQAGKFWVFVSHALKGGSCLKVGCTNVSLAWYEEPWAECMGTTSLSCLNGNTHGIFPLAMQCLSTRVPPLPCQGRPVMLVCTVADPCWLTPKGSIQLMPASRGMKTVNIVLFTSAGALHACSLMESSVPFRSVVLASVRS